MLLVMVVIGQFCPVVIGHQDIAATSLDSEDDYRSGSGNVSH